MEDLINEKNELENKIILIKNKINDLETNTIPLDIQTIIDEIENKVTDSTDITESLNRLQTIKGIDETAVAGPDQTAEFAKKIYSFSNDDTKEKIIQELTTDEITELNFFDEALKFFDLGFSGTKLINIGNPTNVFSGKKINELKTDITNKGEFTNAKSLKTEINNIATQLKTTYKDTSEIDKIINKKLSDITPIAVTFTGHNYKLSNANNIHAASNGNPYPDKKCIDAIDDFFKGMDTLATITKTTQKHLPITYSQDNVKKIMEIIENIKKEFEETIPKIIKAYMDTQAGGAFDLAGHKNGLLISIYIDILTSYLTIINTRIAEIDLILGTPAPSRPTTGVPPTSDNSTGTTNSRIEAATNAASTIKNYLAIFMESRLKALNQFDMMLIEYLQELELPNHIAISIFMIPKMSVIRDIIQSQAADKMFAIYEITRLKKESDYVRFEQNYGPVNPMMPFY